MLDGLLDAVQRAGVHGRLPGGGLGLRLEPHLKEGTRGNETWLSREGITLRTVTEVVRSYEEIGYFQITSSVRAMHCQNFYVAYTEESCIKSR